MNDDYEDHKSKATEFLAMAGDCETYDSERERYYLSAAKVHATLALAAATRANKTVTVREDRP